MVSRVAATHAHGGRVALLTRAPPEKKRREAEKTVLGVATSIKENSQPTPGSGASKTDVDAVPPVDDSAHAWAENLIAPNDLNIAGVDINLSTMDQYIYQEAASSYPSDGTGLGPYMAEALTAWDTAPWGEPGHTACNHLSQSNSTREQGQIPQRRTSDSDLRSVHAERDLPHFQHAHLSRLLTTSKKKGWLGNLHIAAIRGNERALQLLLSSENIDINQQDSDDRTPLIHAVIEGHESVVRLLLARGARIGVLECDNRTAIHWAVLLRRQEILRLLLEHRAEYELELGIDIHDRYGWTPLHVAIDGGLDECMTLLLNAGADIHIEAGKCPTLGRVIQYLDRNEKL